MDTEQSTLRFLQPTDSSNYDHRINIAGSHHQLHGDHNIQDPRRIDSEGEDTSSSIISSGNEDVPDRMNTDLLLNQEQEQEGISINDPFIDNNDNSGKIDQVFISVDTISNCQEESEIQLDSSIDNNSNTTEINTLLESNNSLSGLTRNLQPIILEEGQVYNRSLPNNE